MSIGVTGEIMKEWFLSTELMHLEGMPNSTTAVSRKASRNNWLKRKASVKGKAMEYHISNFHFDIQKSLYEKYATELDKQNLGEVFDKSVQDFYETQASEWERYIQSEELHGANLPASIQPISTINEWCNLKLFDVHAAAGAGNLINSEFQIGMLQIPCDWLKDFNLDEFTAAVIYVDGDSMEPTLNHKDRLLVDIREQQHPVANGVYVIRIDDAVYVKRLRWDIADGVYEVISDNPAHKNFQINHNNGRNFKIIGKAVTTLMKPIL